MRTTELAEGTARLQDVRGIGRPDRMSEFPRSQAMALIRKRSRASAGRPSLRDAVARDPRFAPTIGSPSRSG